MANEHEMDDAIGIISETFGTFRAEMEQVNRVASKIAKKTQWFIRITMGIIAVAFAYVFFQVTQVTTNMVDMIGSMDTMLNRFGGMSEDMGHLTAAVQSMGDNIQGMPVIAQDMQRMNQDVAGMQNSVSAMLADVTSMDKNVDTIRLSTYQMADRFVSVNGAVSHMNYNVWQMSRPTNMFGPMNWLSPP
ncbi:MAG: hypothetical protein HQL74_03745 [Magnetococcales bacterium]|nr:hypothetical protein [Magnetococcales bacterium]